MTSGAMFHLAPVDVWEAQMDDPSYSPEAFEREGFIHCTDGEQRVLETGNRYYTGDRRAYCLLTIDRELVTAEIVYEDAERVFPHIYGMLNTSAVVEVRSIRRGPAGEFLAIEPIAGDR